MLEGRIEYPAYIVLDIPVPMEKRIQSLRSRFDAERADMPAEVTLTGSCGVGTILPGQEISLIAREMDKVAARFAPFEAEFDHVERFLNTDIYYLAFRDPAPFAALHKALAETEIRFRHTEYPFVPHCTLKLRQHPTEQELLELFFLNAPRDPFRLGRMSLYSLPGPTECILHHRVALSGSQPPA